MFKLGHFVRRAFLSILTLSLAISPIVHAEVRIPREAEFAENGIVFYNPDACGPSSGGSSRESVSGGQITWIGDSYSVGAESIINEKFPGVVIDASVGRNVSEGLSILENLISSEELRAYLVFALGTNGGWISSYADTFKQLLDNTNTKAVLVTSKIPGNDYSTSNDILRGLTQSPNISLADWTSVYKEEFFESDPEKIHPYSNGGYEAWVDVIAKNLGSGGSSGSSSGLSGGGTTLYNGEPVLADIWKTRVQENLPFYEEAAEKYNIPWQIIATIHIKEHGALRDNPANGQGAYQLYSYTNGGTNSNSFLPPGPISDEEFRRQTDIAVGQVIAPKAANLDLNSETGVKKLFFSYNGVADAYKSQARSLGFSQEEADRGEGSPYVMNRADLIRDPTVEPTRSNNTWGQIKTDGGGMSYPANSDPGAYLIYLALGGTGWESSGRNNNHCYNGNGMGGVVEDGGLTIEQAKIFMMNYGTNAGNDSANAVGELWDYCGGGGSNCVTFSAFFLNKFTGTRYAGGNGYQVVANLSHGAEPQTTPQVWAVWSVGNCSDDDCTNHTGIVLGIHGDQYIIGHASCSRGHNGIRGRGDGTVNGDGSGFITIEGPDPSTWYGANGMQVTFYYPDSVNVGLIESYINQ